MTLNYIGQTDLVQFSNKEIETWRDLYMLPKASGVIMDWVGTGIRVLLLLFHAINFFIHAANIYYIYFVPSIGLCAGKKRRLVEYVLYTWLHHECLYVHTPSFLYLMGLIRAHHTASLSSGLRQLISNPQSLFFFLYYTRIYKEAIFSSLLSVIFARDTGM